MTFYSYIAASRRNGTLYIGSTDDLVRRIEEHREYLVWYEVFETREDAFRRERRLKEWRRSWKLMLIEAGNPTWRDLSRDLNLNA